MSEKGCNINTNPPKLDSEGAGFKTWKVDIELWTTVTKVAKKDRAITIYLSLVGKPKLAAQQISQDQLKQEDGVEILLKTLGNEFLPNKAMRLFNANNKLRHVVRKSGTKVHDFITEFDHAKFQLEQEGLKKMTLYQHWSYCHNVNYLKIKHNLLCQG